MVICYKKLWKLLVDKDLKKKDLPAIAGISRSSIKKSGHDPYAQIYGYLTAGNDMYITRTGNARELIKQLDKAQLLAYVKRYGGIQ